MLEERDVFIPVEVLLEAELCVREEISRVRSGADVLGNAALAVPPLSMVPFTGTSYSGCEHRETISVIKGKKEKFLPSHQNHYDKNHDTSLATNSIMVFMIILTIIIKTITRV